VEAAQEQSKADAIKARVSAYIEVNGCRIGIILPEDDPDPDDLSELYHTLAEVHVRQAKKKAAQE